jgi:hypothetical protein
MLALVAGLVAAGNAAATATYDPSTYSWFIGRGDVIAAGGKAALVPYADVNWSVAGNWTQRCTWADGYQESFTNTFYSVRSYYAQARYAPGNGNITGYTTGKPWAGDDNVTYGGPQWCGDLDRVSQLHGAFVSQTNSPYTVTSEALWFGNYQLQDVDFPS